MNNKKPKVNPQQLPQNTPEILQQKAESKPSQVSSGVDGLAQIGTDFANQMKQEVASVIPDALRMLLGQPTSVDTQPEQMAAQSKESDYWKRRYQMAEMQRQAERSLYLQRQQEQAQKVESIREELRVVAKQVDSFTVEAEIVASQEVAEVGVYHEHFFAKLLSFLKNLAKRINRARHWLATQNTRSKKMHPFMRKKNTMQVDAYLSGERASAFGG